MVFAQPSKTYRLWSVVLVLLLAAWARMIYVHSLPMNADEIWSIWQTLGTPLDVIRWTPSDWSFPYFMTIWGWKEIVGLTPEALRMLSVLISLLGGACLYTAVRHIWNHKTALMALVIYAGFGFSIFLGLLLRAYGILLMLVPIVLLLAWRYLEKPTFRRAFWLALSSVVMFFVHFTAALALVAIGVLVTVCFPRRVWRLWLPGVMAVPLPLAHIIVNWQFISTRTGTNALIALPPLPQALVESFCQFAGGGALLWLVVCTVATLLAFAALVRQPSVRLRAFALLAWIALILPMYLLHHRLGLFQDLRYLWWVMPGIVLWMAFGLAQLPAVGRGVAVVGLAALALYPGAAAAYQRDQFFSEITLNIHLRELQRYMLPGDVVVVDQNNICAPIEAWDYFHRVFFPNGLPYVGSYSDARRIWYVSTDWLQDPATREGVTAGRVAGKYFGPPACLFRLYEAPPDREGIRFENGLRLHGVEILSAPTYAGAIFHEGETLRARIWWSVDEVLTLDYSVNLFTATPDGSVENNAPPRPLEGPEQTSQWQPGRYYVEERELILPYPLVSGQYDLQLIVYQWWDGVRLDAPTADANKALLVGRFLVHSW
ncbi:MAG: glycosyltransferase family 39 protein [Chloroflexota bacterium]|nr:glycosyltransferase family 39 protein [Chloroflexota bacterium]